MSDIEVIVRQVVSEMIRDNLLKDEVYELVSSQQWIDAAALHAGAALDRMRQDSGK